MLRNIIILTYLLTPWYRLLLEKLTGLQLVKKFPAFHGTRRFITALTSVRHLSLSWTSPITAIKKNRDEKGSRAEIFVSNPHSNGDLFSRSSFIFLEISVVNTIMAADNRMFTVAAVIIIIITYLFFYKFLDWKSSILYCIR